MLNKIEKTHNKILFLAFCLLLALISTSIFIYFIPHFLNLPIDINSLKKSNVIDFRFYCVAVVLFIPIMEELIFRSALILNSNNLRLFISSVFGCIVYILFLKINHPVAFILFFLVFILSYYVLIKTKLLNVKPKYQNDKFLYFLLIISSILFALLHFKLNIESINLRYILRFIHFIIISFMLGIIRIKCGLQWSIFLHSLKNLSAFILPYLFVHFKYLF